MQLNELKTFLAIIDTGSLVRASEQLNVTQSTITTRLKSLENELGQTLINRQKSGASLTAAGVRLQRYALTICELWQQARLETALPHGYSNVVNFGCHTDLWTGMGSPLFNFIKSSKPQAAVSVARASSEELSDALRNGLIDLALTYSPHSNQAQGSIEAVLDQLILVSTCKDSPIRFDPEYVFIEAGEEFGQQHAAAYSDAGTARINFNSAQLGLEYLLQHGGSAYLPLRLAADAIKAGKLHQLPQAPVFQRQAYLTFNKTAREKWHWFDEYLKTLDVSCDMTGVEG